MHTLVHEVDSEQPPAALFLKHRASPMCRCTMQAERSRERSTSINFGPMQRTLSSVPRDHKATYGQMMLVSSTVYTRHGSLTGTALYELDFQLSCSISYDLQFIRFKQHLETAQLRKERRETTFGSKVDVLLNSHRGHINALRPCANRQALDLKFPPI